MVQLQFDLAYDWSVNTTTFLLYLTLHPLKCEVVNTRMPNERLIAVC